MCHRFEGGRWHQLLSRVARPIPQIKRGMDAAGLGAAGLHDTKACTVARSGRRLTRSRVGFCSLTVRPKPISARSSRLKVSMVAGCEGRGKNKRGYAQDERNPAPLQLPH